MNEGDPYLYSGISVLRNKFDIRDAAYLDYVERPRGIPARKFRLAHICAIHRYLFQDIYDWVGNVRILEVVKGGSRVS